MPKINYDPIGQFHYCIIGGKKHSVSDEELSKSGLTADRWFDRISNPKAKHKIIAFGHRRGVGKDTSGNYLKTILRLKNYDIEKISFAWKLKDVCFQLYGWAGMQPPEYYDEHYTRKDDMLKIGKTVREVWIEVGNLLRNVYARTWVDHALLGSKADCKIITDLRYPNEAERIKELGGLCIKIERPDIPKSNDVADTALEGYTGWNKILVNDGTLAQLNEQMFRLAQEYVFNA